MHGRSAPGGEPLVVFGAGSLAYDFGPQHPLTPRRFGPGIDLLRSVGAARFLSPEAAPDEALVSVHQPHYVAAVRRLSASPREAPEFGFSAHGDDPPFAGMHDAAATVAGGSLAAIDAIVSGKAVRAFHPGGGLHHAMESRASGFCIYNDVAVAIARAREAGHRVLYVDLDVHHGDGVQAIFWDDPAVLTISIHESGASLFPGTGFVDETGGPAARGTAVNVPLEPGSGDASWLAGLGAVVPALAEAFRPTLLVSQHGCDGHVLDPLAHLRLTTAAMHAAARLLDGVADAFADGRWLATGGGGYDAYRVVPRAWAIVWLAQAKRSLPDRVPEAWRARWQTAAAAQRQAPLPMRFADEPGLVEPDDPAAVVRARRTAEHARQTALAYLRGG